jgi:hypothetical protein
MGPRGLVMLRLGMSVGVHSNLHLLCLQIALPKSKSISPFAMTTNKSLIADWVLPERLPASRVRPRAAASSRVSRAIYACLESAPSPSDRGW